MLKTTHEIAITYGFSASYIRKLINDGKIKAVTVGRMYLIDPSKIEELNRQRQPRKKKRKKDNGHTKQTIRRKRRTV